MARRPTPASIKVVWDLVAEAETTKHPPWRRSLIDLIAKTLGYCIEQAASAGALPAPLTVDELHPGRRDAGGT
jgi:hypothetical protein